MIGLSKKTLILTFTLAFNGVPSDASEWQGITCFSFNSQDSAFGSMQYSMTYDEFKIKNSESIYPFEFIFYSSHDQDLDLNTDSGAIALILSNIYPTNVRDEIWIRISALLDKAVLFKMSSNQVVDEAPSKLDSKCKDVIFIFKPNFRLPNDPEYIGDLRRWTTLLPRGRAMILLRIAAQQLFDSYNLPPGENIDRFILTVLTGKFQKMNQTEVMNWYEENFLTKLQESKEVNSF